MVVVHARTRLKPRRHTMHPYHAPASAAVRAKDKRGLSLKQRAGPSARRRKEGETSATCAASCRNTQARSGIHETQTYVLVAVDGQSERRKDDEPRPNRVRCHLFAWVSRV